jgi:hypothetical protein
MTGDSIVSLTELSTAIGTGSAGIATLAPTGAAGSSAVRRPANTK